MLAENKAGERDEESRTAAETSRFGKGSRENNWKYWCVNLFPKPLSPQFQIAMHYRCLRSTPEIDRRARWWIIQSFTL